MTIRPSEGDCCYYDSHFWQIKKVVDLPNGTTAVYIEDDSIKRAHLVDVDHLIKEGTLIKTQ